MSSTASRARWDLGADFGDSLGGSGVAPKPQQWHPQPAAAPQQSTSTVASRFFGQPAAPQPKQTGKVVEVEALALIKIMKHCCDNFPTPVNGILLGLDTTEDNILEVSDCFGLQSKRELYAQYAKDKSDPRDVEEKIAAQQSDYQAKVLEQLNAVNVDCCTVGWYQTLQFEDLKDPNIVHGLYEHIKDAVVIGFNPELASLGPEAFKAFRLSEKARQCRQDAEKEKDANSAFGLFFNKLRSKEILVEVPIVVRNSLLADAFALDLLYSDRDLQRAAIFDCLGLNERTDYLSKGLTFVTSCMDDLQTEQDKMTRALKDVMRDIHQHKEKVERRKLENEQRALRKEEPLPDLPPFNTVRHAELPSQLPILLMAQNVSKVSDRITSSIGDTVAQSYLTYHEALP